ncbi:MAG: glycosyltransferase [Rhodocyclaceae bacterium]|nr:glycosyltransferase [Rhodocyclaceae bacterium]
MLPCHNEAAAVAKVVSDFRLALPMAEIHVFDNDSSDSTVAVARAAGARVHAVSRRGKGNVVRRMFADIDADIYVLADGDATYDAASAPIMIGRLVGADLDMVVGTRAHQRNEAYRPGHQIGNRLLTGAMRRIFGGTFTDMLSGYRVLSRRFVKSFPATSHGFEIETELTIHAQELRMPCAEVTTTYGVRPTGSESKLRTYADGWRILVTIIRLFAIERPFRFYGAMSLLVGLISLGLAAPLLITYVNSGAVPRLPTAVLATGLGMMAGLSFFAGLILETVTVGRRELRHLIYLSVGTFARRRRSDD